MDAIPGMYRAFRSRLDLRSSVLDTYVCVRMHELGPKSNIVFCLLPQPPLALCSRFLPLPSSHFLYLSFICRPVSLFLPLYSSLSLLSLSLASLFLVHPGRTLCTQGNTR